MPKRKKIKKGERKRRARERKREAAFKAEIRALETKIKQAEAARRRYAKYLSLVGMVGMPTIVTAGGVGFEPQPGDTHGPYAATIFGPYADGPDPLADEKRWYTQWPPAPLAKNVFRNELLEGAASDIGPVLSTLLGYA